MKILKFAVIALLASSVFIACKKDKEEIDNSAVGVYNGKYGFDNEVPDTDFKFEVKAGGVFREIGTNSGVTTGEGTWQMNGNTLTAHYTMKFSPFSEYSISATFNPTTGKLTGTWGYDNNPSDGGKIDMTRL